MPITKTIHPVSPGAGGMLITLDKPLDFMGRDLPSTTAPPQRLRIEPKTGANGASQLTAAGMVAMVTAINTHFTGLSATNRDDIATRLPGGLSVTVTPRLIEVPCHAAGVNTLAAALQAVLNTGANVTTY
jgi:hypothetical protein